MKDEFKFDQEIIDAFNLDNPDIDFLLQRYKNLAQRYKNIDSSESRKVSKNYFVLELCVDDILSDWHADYLLETDDQVYEDAFNNGVEASDILNQIMFFLVMRSILVAECLNPAFDKYSKILVRKYKQLNIKDDYGDINLEYWIKELEWFYKNKIEQEADNVWSVNLPKLDFLLVENKGYKLSLHLELSNDSFNFGTHYLWNLVIDSKLTKEFVEGEDDLQYCENMGGLEYEEFIKNCFIKNGCEARVTKASGDQGVDVVAEIGDKRIAVQCKHYNSKVGNDAIQQVYSAKNFFDCDIAVVISNNNFTNQAKQLASKLGVYLLHHEDVEGFVKEIAWY